MATAAIALVVGNLFASIAAKRVYDTVYMEDPQAPPERAAATIKQPKLPKSTTTAASTKVTLYDSFSTNTSTSSATVSPSSASDVVGDNHFPVALYEATRVRSHAPIDYESHILPDPSISPSILHFNKVLREDPEKTRKPNCIDDPLAVVYVVGDLDGRLTSLCKWMITMKLLQVSLIKGEHHMKWIGDAHTYVVQCGDQIDGDRVTSIRKDFDLSVPLFMDYMFEISNGKVRSIIGNHEFMNVDNDTTYIDRSNTERLDTLQRRATDGKSRTALFGYDALFGRVLRRRHFLLRINNAIFSHAGHSHRELLTFQKICDLSTPPTMDDYINSVNKEVSFPANFNTNMQTKIFQHVVHGKSNISGILWNRDYNGTTVPVSPFGYETRVDTGPSVNINVSGHNKQTPSVKIYQYPTVNRAFKALSDHISKLPASSALLAEYVRSLDDDDDDEDALYNAISLLDEASVLKLLRMKDNECVAIVASSFPNLPWLGLAMCDRLPSLQDVIGADMFMQVLSSIRNTTVKAKLARSLTKPQLERILKELESDDDKAALLFMNKSMPWIHENATYKALLDKYLASLHRKSHASYDTRHIPAAIAFDAWHDTPSVYVDEFTWVAGNTLAPLSSPTEQRIRVPAVPGRSDIVHGQTFDVLSIPDANDYYILTDAISLKDSFKIPYVRLQSSTKNGVFDEACTSDFVCDVACRSDTSPIFDAYAIIAHCVFKMSGSDYIDSVSAAKSI